MHLIDPDIGLMGTVPIVAATIPMAAGAALAAKLDGSDAVGCSFFGDGASEEGSFHETMNLASTHKLPIVFVCENNLFSSHLHISARQPYDSVVRFADVHGLEGVVVDGNDVVAVETAAKSLRDLRVAEVSQLDVKVEDGKVVAYRCRVSLSFKYQPE